GAGARPFSLRSERIRSSPRRAVLGGAGVVAVSLVGALGFAFWHRIDWRSLASWPPATAASRIAPAARELPPLPRRGEPTLARATELASSGHLRDALSVLDTVRPTDAQKAAAD